MGIDVAVLAGTVSTVIFASSVMPMLLKAAKTRDLASYSMGNLLLSNIGNAVHSVYIYSLPAGPIWVLHSFYLVATGYMLVMYLRHGRHPREVEAPALLELSTPELAADSELAAARRT
jgi:uncharacterized protein with PQ loop repeat